MAVTILPAVYVLYRIHKMHLPASRRIANLDQEAKSPVFQQFTETVEGISTIRAFQMEGWHRKDFLARLDESQRPYYLVLCIQRWLNFACSVVVGILAVLLMFFATATNSSSAGNMGAALTTMLTASVKIQNLISSWSSAESSLTSVARVKDFEETTPNENCRATPQPRPPILESHGPMAASK
jgi:ATP-binding cassette subfamily C (CFTR/MRP) protein 1